MKNIFNSAKKAFKSKPTLQFILMGLVVAISVNMEAQVTVAGSTGANASYTTLKDAFDAINLNNNQTGNAITISITANTTEIAPAVLNQPTAGSWATLVISPSGGAAITVTGASPLPLIGLNGADNVTIDGLNTGGNSLTISNTSTSSTGATTIVYYADASNNILQNCTIEGSSTSAALATIAFSTGTVTGNDGNTITGCTITSAGSNLPFNAIGSAGTSALIDNSGISITNNKIKDYYSPGTASNGIFVSSFSSAWTITGNKIFQTAARTATAGSTHRAINIVTASGGGYTISNNTIGYATATATGVTTYDGGFASRFLGIELTAAATPVSSIQGNTIAAITLSTTSGATLAPGIFSGISVLGGTVDIGTITGNTIGAATGNGSISITSTTSLPYIAGIYAKSTGTVTIQNNTIGAINTAGTAGIGYTFNGINTAGAAGNFTVSGNTIGSTTTAHSIAIGTSGTTTAICKFKGIYNAATGTISITGNTIQNTSAFGTGASAFTGIAVDSCSATSVLSIATNNIISGTNTGTGNFIGISNTAVAATANINNNIVRSNTLSSTSGAFTGIENSGTVTTAINFKDNQLGNSTGGLVTYSAANSATLKGISNTGGAVGALLSVTGNDFRGITNTVGTSSDHIYINNSTFKGSTNISTNTFTALNVNTSGDVTFISNNVTHNANTSHSVNSNAVITGYNNTGAGGTVFFYDSYNLSPSTVTETNTSNNFSNLAFAGNTTISGWRSSDGTTPGPKKTVTNNIFRNITAGSGSITILNAGYADNTSATNNISGNTIANIIGGSNITGIVSDWGNQNFFNNTIDSLLSSGSGVVTGISITDGTSQNIYKNKIYYLSNSNTSGAVDGLAIDGSTTANVYNNIIGDLRTPASTFTDAIRGISITSTSSASTINAYYNTIYINATSNGTNFGTTGIFHTASTTATTATLNLRNNIIVNTSTPAGTGLTVAYRRSAGSANSLANYAATSNNNLFYAGTPGTANLIYSDGVSTAQTMTAYKAGAFTAGTIASRDVSSITESPTFVSTTGSNINFLHINTTIATQIESGAVNIATITGDFDADIRQGNPGYAGTGTSPDMGADEFNGVPLDLIAPVISYTALTNNSCLVNDTLSATITDGTGINTTAGTKPRIWFKKTTNLNTLPGTNTNTTDGWKYTEATNSTSPFSLVLDYSLVFGGVAVGDTVQYFVTAQDAVTPTPNISINSGTFAAPPTSVALTLAAFPIGGTVNSYKILSGLSGTVTVGTGGTYTTLTGASGLFDAINTSGLAGNLTVNILTGGTTETGATALNSIGYGCSSNYTILIKPSTGVTATLTGSSATALIKLKGADYVTFDGSNSGGTTRDLTITNTNTGTSSAVIWIGSASTTDGAVNNTVKNCILMGNAPTTTFVAIVSSSGTTMGSVAEAANANNTYENNVINTCSYGIAVVGPATGDSATTISNNLIGSATALNKIGFRGLFISNQTNFIASNNTIFGVNTASTSTASGIIVSGTISGGIINANKISDVKNTNTGGWGCNGLMINATSTASNIVISNNMIYDVASYGYASGDGSSDNGYGIIVTNGGGYNFYYNSVSMNTNQTISGLPAAFNITSAVTTANSLNVRNNIFSNTQSLGTERFSIICNAANTVFTDINYNDYDAGTAPNLGYFGSNTANLAAWKVATGKDVNSLSVPPVFTSATDLHLVVASNCGIDHTGTPITGIIADIDNDTRDANNPDMGADEFTNPAPVLSSTLTPTAICSGATFTYTASSATSGATFGWSRATIAGITEVGTTGTANISEVLTNTTGLPINVIYVYTTTFTLCSNIQNVTVTVNPQPTLSSTLTPPSICTGSAFTYTATSLSSGATFTWARAAVTGISQAASSGSGNVNEVLTNTTSSPISVTYVYVTTANGCTSTPGESVVVSIGQVPVLSSSLTPSMCSGTTFTYTATSTTPGVSFTWSRATVSGITEPGTAGTANVSEILTNTTTSPVTVTYAYITNASGCAGGTQNVVVTVYNKPTVSLAPFTDTVCFQAPAFALTGGSPAGGVYAGTGVSSGMFSPSGAGVGPESITYTVTVSGCSNAASQNILVEQCAGIEENSFSQAVSTYPNPNNGKFNITISNANFNQLSISIVDVQGKEVYYEMDKNNTAEYSKQIDVKSLAKGIYYIKLVTDADIAIQKLVIE
ncbi:MAG: T9SS type A sorting domain-containing protein [Bacteroidetes bacterium]|nr:T9SS type A sorting domain-containing protein [Bacteroidota bacterium]